MQGLYVINAEGDGWTRPRSKREVRDLIANGPEQVRIESTSVFGNEFEGTADDMPIAQPVYFVGPDPYTKRNFYGTLLRTRDNKWTVK